MPNCLSYQQPPVGVAVVSAALRMKAAPSALSEISLSLFPHRALIYLKGFL